MTFGFAPSKPASLPTSNDSAARLGRMLEPSEWASAGIPLLRDPRRVVTGLHDRHLPGPGTAVVAVLDLDERVTASASFKQFATAPDGWEFRNALLARLRRIIPHDLRLRVPVRTAVLLYSREGAARWTEADGAWMWGLRDACTLHGLRCGAYVVLTRAGWQVLGEARGGRHPHTGSPASGAAATAAAVSSASTASMASSGSSASAASAANGAPEADGAAEGGRGECGAGSLLAGAGGPRRGGGGTGTTPEVQRRTAAR